MNVLVLGKNGMLAHAVARNFLRKGIRFEVLGRPEICAKELDSWNVDFKKFDYAINCIGLTNRWEKKVERKTFISVNSTFPHQLAERCRSAQTRLIHMSTDCVFSGRPGPHFEDTTPDGKGDYAESKILGEPADQALVIRTSIIGPEKTNFYSPWSWVCSQKGMSINGFIDHLWNGMTTHQLAECFSKIIKEENYVVGIRHLYSPESVSKLELVQMILDVCNLKSSQVQAVIADEPKDMRLATRYPKFIEKLDILPLSTQPQIIARELKI